MIHYNRKRQVQLVVRHLPDGRSEVGYWDGDSGDSGRDFRVLCIKPTMEQAVQVAEKIIAKDKRYY